MEKSFCVCWKKPAAIESRYPTYGACWCLGVSKIHRTLTGTTGSLTCAQMLMHTFARGGVRSPSESLHWKLGLGEKSLAVPESNLRQRRVGPMLYQLSYILVLLKHEETCPMHNDFFLFFFLLVIWWGLFCPESLNTAHFKSACWLIK